MSTELNSWNGAKSRGKQAETYVLQKLMPSIGLSCTDNTIINPTGVDTNVEGYDVEVKTAFTPYPSSPTPAKLTSIEHITLDTSNIMKYDREVFIIILCRYTNPKVYITTAGIIRDIIDQNPKRQYKRSPRSFKDKQAKIGISIYDCIDITDYFPKKVIEEMNKIE